jgi:transposase-like protein
MNWDYEPHCPYCQEQQTDLWELGMNDGDVRAFECTSCGKEIDLHCCITIEYLAVKKGTSPYDVHEQR